jgi:hypothetical protein
MDAVMKTVRRFLPAAAFACLLALVPPFGARAQQASED